MNTSSLITETKAKFNFNLAKVHIKEKYKNKLIVAEQGGLWKITPELIAFASLAVDEVMILLDTYENPVEVNRVAFLAKISSEYKTVMQEYLDEWKKLKNIR